MSRAYLTIDDAPTKLTPKIVDYLALKGIVAVINFVGKNVEKHFEEAVYAVNKGAVIGNHSFSHPHFSALSIDECRNEIEQTEAQIDRVYKASGAKRIHRIFRFPYGDKGGANAPLLQKMLKEEFRFDRLDDSDISFFWWKDNNLHIDIDMFWTFDFREYELAWGKGYTWDSIVKRILDKEPPNGGALLNDSSQHIILMHDTEATDEFLPDYYKKLIDYTLSLGVEYIKPKFVVI